MRSPFPSPDPARSSQHLHALLAGFSACGATPTGGITRLCASPADGMARTLFATTARESGGDVRTDVVGNQFAVFPLTGRAGAPLVMVGSHLDSQAKAGRFDGTLGVAAGLASATALMAAKRAGADFAADLCVVNWTNEEGARFRPSLLGSGVYAGLHAPDDALARRDDDGVSLGQALAVIGALGVDAPPPRPACYLELHVEQGSILEENGATIGIVTRNWGATKLDIVFEGEQAHTGPCVMPRRRDALLAAAYAIADIRAVADRWPGRVHTSVGRMLVAPNSANVVASRVELSVEIRSADDRLLAEAARLADDGFRLSAERAKVEVLLAGRVERPVRALPASVSDLVAFCAEETGHRGLRMDTVAGHDALSLLGICPTGLIFVPSIDGIAHNEAEETSKADLDAGLAVLLRAAFRLCRAGGSPDTALRFDCGDPA